MGVTVILREGKRGINVEEYMKWCHEKSLSIRMVRYLTDNWDFSEQFKFWKMKH